MGLPGNKKGETVSELSSCLGLAAYGGLSSSQFQAFDISIDLHEHLTQRRTRDVDFGALDLAPHIDDPSNNQDHLFGGLVLAPLLDGFVGLSKSGRGRPSSKNKSAENLSMMSGNEQTCRSWYSSASAWPFSGSGSDSRGSLLIITIDALCDRRSSRLF